MADDAPTDAPEKPTTPTPPESDGKDNTFTQEQVNDLIAREKGKFQQRYADYDELKAAKGRLDEIEESNRTEVEKAQGKLTKAEERAAAAEAKLARFEVAKDKSVPAAAVDFLQGNTREELEASADKLLELVKKEEGGDTPPDFNGGPREPAPENKTPDQAHAELVTKLFTGQPPS